MFTPQQIEQIAFNRVPFGGYDMQAVDEFLEPLTEDYVTLYKENALLKSKMRVLVEKLEEYRKNEASMKDAIINAQKTCDKMVRDAEVKCTQMLNDASAAATENTKNADSIIAAEEARVEAAKVAASKKIDEIQAQMRACVQALERIKTANLPKPQPSVSGSAPFDFDNPDASSSVNADAVADEISHNLEALVGTTDDVVDKTDANHPVSDTTSKFANLQFGRNYDPNHK
jgi:cell division initiation protein